jgi:hypothetical protein
MTWLPSFVRRYQEDQFLKNLLRTKGEVDLVTDRFVEDFLRAERFYGRIRLYFRWVILVCKSGCAWASSKFSKNAEEKSPVGNVEFEADHEGEGK